MPDGYVVCMMCVMNHHLLMCMFHVAPAAVRTTTPLRWILNSVVKKDTVTHSESCDMSAVNLLASREQAI